MGVTEAGTVHPPSDGRWYGDVWVAPAIEGDALATYALIREIIAEDRWLVTYPDEADLTLDAHRRELAGSGANAFHLVARTPDRRVVGFVRVIGGERLRTRHVASVELLVSAAFRRRGIGRMLLGETVATARATGILRKLSVALFVDNAAAIALFRSAGFADEGRRIGQYQERDGRLRGDLLLAKFV